VWKESQKKVRLWENGQRDVPLVVLKMREEAVSLYKREKMDSRCETREAASQPLSLW
jgi:hypothetical protein